MEKKTLTVSNDNDHIGKTALYHAETLTQRIDHSKGILDKNILNPHVQSMVKQGYPEQRSKGMILGYFEIINMRSFDQTIAETNTIRRGRGAQRRQMIERLEERKGFSRSRSKDRGRER